MQNRDFNIIGKSIALKDAQEKVTGNLQYVTDLKYPGNASS